MTTAATQAGEREHEDVALVPFARAHLEGALKLSQEMSWPYLLKDWDSALLLGRGFVVTSAGAVMGTALWWINMPGGHRFLASRISQMAPKSGLRISVGRIEGSIYSKTILRDVRLGDPGDERLATGLVGREVEQVPGDPLADRRERAAGDLVDEPDDAIAELVEQRRCHGELLVGHAPDDVRSELEQLGVGERVERPGHRVRLTEQRGDAQQAARSGKQQRLR